MATNFDWSNFTVEFIRAIVYSPQTKRKPASDTRKKEILVSHLWNIATAPSYAFVKTYRKEIEDYFLKDSTYLVDIIKKLSDRNVKGINASTMDSMLLSVKNKRTTQTILDLYAKALLQAGSKTKDYGDYGYSYTNPISIDLTNSIDGTYPLFDYQEKAKEALCRHFIDNDKNAGILVMPTGSGKTRVFTKFILEDIIPQGYQVIFLTHRALLIEQCGGSVYTAAPILKHTAPDKSNFNMICISGSHATIKQASKKDDVIILGVQTAIRNLAYLKAIVKDKVFIVCDEMHHSSAPSFSITINEIKKIAKKSKLLGLTATPVRTNERETVRLMNMYDNSIVHQIDAAELIAKGYLATPIVESVPTNIDMQSIISLDEKKYIEKWGEISPELLDKMADIKERNTVIVEQYMRNRDRYGKTLIFALNSKHCISLCEALQNKGIRCDYIYCAHPGNDEKIRKFKNGELDVLVNINVLTEGSDIPDIESVFLTRPTQSDVLLMQMCGRGLRGEACGGTKTVNIVDFHDMWGRAEAWLNPEFILNSSIEEADTKKQETEAKATVLIPWAMIRDLLDGIEVAFAPGGEFVSNVVLPSGWYDVVTEDGTDSKVLFFESQLSGYKKLWENKNVFLTNPLYTGDDALHDFFPGIGLMPSSHELDLVMNTARLSNEMLHPYAFENRKSIDPMIIAAKVREENIGYNDISKLTESIYKEKNTLIDSLYGGYDAYNGKVLDSLRYPNGIKPLGTKVEEMELSLIQYDSAPAYNLNELTEEVLTEMFHGLYGSVPRIEWTEDKPKTYFGQYNYCTDRSKDFIKINSVLNSKSVPREAVKYIIYHELLHRDCRYHNSAFRGKEHLYPNWTAMETFLDGTFPMFDINYSI